ncbi:MAG TPA: MarR family transcriptional regulator [Opitutales bacterium]|nr:MarR family transcriptional regulator [Opitutales bacterium]
MSNPAITLAQSEFEALAAYRHALRRFLQFSVETARSAGLTPQQYQVLLAVKAARAPLSIGELALTMQLRHHSTVGLVDRLVRRHWLRRMPDPTDARRVRLQLTASGDKLLTEVAMVNRGELRRIGPELIHSLESLGVA